MNIETVQEFANFTGVVVFTAPWCGPCKSYKPRLEAWCKGKGIPLGVVDASVSKDLVLQAGVRAVPTTLFVNEGVIGAVRLTGAVVESNLDTLDLP